MFMLINGKAILKPFKVTYERKIVKVIEEGLFDEETGKFTSPVVETKTKEQSVYFEEFSAATEYAEEVNGVVEDVTPDGDIIKALTTMTFTSLDEVDDFIKNGVKPQTPMSVEDISQRLENLEVLIGPVVAESLLNGTVTNVTAVNKAVEIGFITKKQVDEIAKKR